jgi:hypothetical protein
MITKMGRSTNKANELAYNYDFLWEQYVKLRKSQQQISKEFGFTTPGIVAAGLKKLGIRSRDLSESHITHNNKIILSDAYIGSLLGDGCLEMRNKKTGTACPQFTKSNRGYDHVVYVASQIYPSIYQDRIGRWINSCGNEMFRFQTKNHNELKFEYERWYPNNVKIVPNNLKLTQKILLNWFLDDGTSPFRTNRNGKFTITLCSESFTKSDNEYLISEISKFNIKTYLAKIDAGTGYRIRISDTDACDFLTLIGPCPVSSLAYKWK